MDEPRLAAAIARRRDRFFAPLEQALRVGERPLLFDVRGGGEQEHLRGDVLGLHLAALDLGRRVPERRGLDLHQIAHDEPLEPGERLPLEPGVLRTHRRVLAHDEIAVQLVVGHLHDVLEMRVVLRQLGQPAVAEVVFLRGPLAVVRLEQADDVLGRVVPEAGFLRVLLEVPGEVVLSPLARRASTDNPAACRTASGCPSSPGWTRGRATP